MVLGSRRSLGHEIYPIEPRFLRCLQGKGDVPSMHRVKRAAIDADSRHFHLGFGFYFCGFHLIFISQVAFLHSTYGFAS
jgi:hypothetical protein